MPARIKRLMIMPGFHFEQLSYDAVEHEKRDDFKVCVRQGFEDVFTPEVLKEWGSITDLPPYEPRDGHVRNDHLCAFVRAKLCSVNASIQMREEHPQFLDVEDEPGDKGCWRDPETGKWCKDRRFMLLRGGLPWLMVDAVTRLEEVHGPLPHDHVRAEVAALRAYLNVMWYVEVPEPKEPDRHTENARNDGDNISPPH